MSLDQPQPSEQSPPSPPAPAYVRVANWMPLVVQWTGIGGFIYELLTGSSDAPLIAATVTFAVGGKLADLIKGSL